MRISDTRQFWSGALFLAVGALALWNVPKPLGTASAMGPGYFPMLLGLGLVLIGLASMVLGLRANRITRVERLPVVPTCCVLGGVVAFGALIEHQGLVVALLLLVGASCYARLLRKPLEVAAMFAILLPVIWAVFIYTIELPIDLF